MNKLELCNDMEFDSIKHFDEYGNEYWLARELMPILQYSNWQNFEKIINKAIMACENSNFKVIDHFTDVSKMIENDFRTYKINNKEVLI